GLRGSSSRFCTGGTFGDLTEQRADRNRRTVSSDDLAQRAGGGRRDLDGDLIGLELHQGLVDCDGIAGLLEPAADGGLGDGFAERRHTNFSHGLFLQWLMPSSSALCALAHWGGRSSIP